MFIHIEVLCFQFSKNKFNWIISGPLESIHLMFSFSELKPHMLNVQLWSYTPCLLFIHLERESQTLSLRASCPCSQKSWNLKPIPQDLFSFLWLTCFPQYGLILMVDCSILYCACPLACMRVLLLSHPLWHLLASLLFCWKYPSEYEVALHPVGLFYICVLCSFTLNTRLTFSKILFVLLSSLEVHKHPSRTN